MTSQTDSGSGYGRDDDDDNKQRLEDGVDEEEEDGEPKPSICCLQGCLAATAVGFSFLVALPTGILLVIYASNNDDKPLLSVGAVLVSLPLLMLIVVVILCLNQRRLARLGKNKISLSPTKLQNCKKSVTKTLTSSSATMTSAVTSDRPKAAAVAAASALTSSSSTSLSPPSSSSSSSAVAATTKDPVPSASERTFPATGQTYYVGSLEAERY